MKNPLSITNEWFHSLLYVNFLIPHGHKIFICPNSQYTKICKNFQRLNLYQIRLLIKKFLNHAHTKIRMFFLNILHYKLVYQYILNIYSSFFKLLTEYHTKKDDFKKLRHLFLTNLTSFQALCYDIFPETTFCWFSSCDSSFFVDLLSSFFINS